MIEFAETSTALIDGSVRLLDLNMFYSDIHTNNFERNWSWLQEFMPLHRNA